MACITTPNGIISLSNTEFKCPFCDTVHNDDNDKYLDRCNRNKCGYTTLKCKGCGKKFGMTHDMKGDAVGFEL